MSTCSCDAGCFGDSPCSCESCYVYACNCDGSCYGYGCACDGSCFGGWSCVCNAMGNDPCPCVVGFTVCTCDWICVEQTACSSCVSACYGDAPCSCVSTCYLHYHAATLVTWIGWESNYRSEV
jgi:hypothetical protein